MNVQVDQQFHLFSTPLSESLFRTTGEFVVIWPFDLPTEGLILVNVLLVNSPKI